MIVDKIENLDMYKTILPEVYAGLKYLEEMDQSIPLGIYPINEKLLVKVMEYGTGEECKVGYEAHKKHLDIHFVVRGHERIKWSPINDMAIKTPYDDKEDAIFYKDPISHPSEVMLGDGVFAVMFPQDGHACTYFVDKCEAIKKIVIKVEID